MTFDPNLPIVCAAIRLADESIICGPRHFDPTMHAQIKRSGAKWTFAEQGFVNSKGQFLNRHDALHVALAHGQRKYRCGGDETKLFSENLY